MTTYSVGDGVVSELIHTVAYSVGDGVVSELIHTVAYSVGDRVVSELIHISCLFCWRWSYTRVNTVTYSVGDGVVLELIRLPILLEMDLTVSTSFCMEAERSIRMYKSRGRFLCGVTETGKVTGSPVGK